MYERIFNTLAALSLVGLGFIGCSIPYLMDEPESPARLEVSLQTYSPKMPRVDYVYGLKARDEAWESTEEARAIVEMALNIKPVRNFEPYKLVYAGSFYLTMYAATVEQCGNTLGITASGKKVTEDPTCWTVAVDPKIIPLGTKLKIDLEGYEDVVFEASDTGGDIKNYWIDVFTESEPLSKSFDPCYADVWIVEEI